MPTALAKAKAIARAIRAARREGQVPEAIVLSPSAHEQLQTAALRYVWSVPKPHSMFGIPVEVDPDVEGWTLRTSPATAPAAAAPPSPKGAADGAGGTRT